MKYEERKELKDKLKKQIDEMSDEELDKIAGGFFESMDQIQWDETRELKVFLPAEGEFLLDHKGIASPDSGLSRLDLVWIKSRGKEMMFSCIPVYGTTMLPKGIELCDDSVSGGMEIHTETVCIKHNWGLPIGGLTS